MNVIMVGEYYNPNLIGGAEVQAMRRAEGLVRMGVNVTVISFDSDNKIAVEETINNVKVIRYPLMTHKAKMLALSVPVARALRKHEPKADLYHLYNTHPLPGGGLYKILGGKKKVIATLENYGGFCPVSTAMSGNCDFACRYSCLRNSSHSMIENLVALPYAIVYPLIEALSRKLDGYLAVSEYVKQKYVLRGFSADKIDVVHNSIDVKDYRKRSKAAHDGINILYVGRMSAEKGVDVLIRAFQRICQIYDNTKLILIGVGQLLERYKVLASELGVDNNVIFTGHISDEMLDYYYSITDVFVHPALWHEPFGITLLEAMTHEVPVLVSDVGSLGNIVKGAGLVFDTGSVADLAAKLDSLIGNKEKVQGLVSNCKTVMTDYSDYKILKTLIQRYESLVNKA